MKKQIFPVLVLILIISFSFSGCITVTIPNIPGLSPNTPSNPPSNADLPAESDQTGTAPAVSSFNSYPSSINYGASSTLSWEVSGASTISIDQGIGNVAASGSTSVSPVADTTYTLSATNASGTTLATSRITVTASSGHQGLSFPVINTFNASARGIVAGESTTLTWNVSNANMVTITPGIGTVPSSGSVSISPSTTTNFVLTATNSAGTSNSAVTVTVSEASASLIGGGCTYRQIPGQATIVSVAAAPSNEYNCANAVQVTFNFVPNDPSAVSNYRFPSWSDSGNHFTVGAGMNPPKNWTQQQGLTTGSTHSCIRAEITNGSCTPVIFLFPSISEDGWETECFTTQQDLSWTGTWDTNWGTMELVQNTGQVTGTYAYDTGKIVGSISKNLLGNILSGTWSEYPSYAPPDDAGDIEFTMSADRMSFTGKWRYDSSGEWRDWHGTRVSP